MITNDTITTFVSGLDNALYINGEPYFPDTWYTTSTATTPIRSYHDVVTATDSTETWYYKDIGEGFRGGAIPGIVRLEPVEPKELEPQMPLNELFAGGLAEEENG